MLNTVILLTSGASITWVQYAIIAEIALKLLMVLF